MLNSLINMVMSGAMQNNPLMKDFNKIMGGKSTDEQIKTLINLAQNKGFDINKKMFSAEDLKNLGLNI